jgi:hypothetical protein
MVKRLLLILAGLISLFLGMAGIVLPLLPATPLVLLASVCFSASSRRLSDWLQRNRVFGPFIENYRTGRGISRFHKVAAVAYLWFGLVISAFIARTTWVYAVLAVVGVCVTIHLLLIKTKH